MITIGIVCYAAGVLVVCRILALSEATPDFG